MATTVNFVQQPPCLRVLIADDHELVPRGNGSLLAVHTRYTVCGEAADSAVAIQNAAELVPDIVVIDISMPYCSSLEGSREIKRVLPQLAVLIVSQRESREIPQQAFKDGARGSIPKSAPAAGLVEGLSKVPRRDSFVTPRMRWAEKST
jgi:DNA-binding NarL/FixJ family response regulator